MYLYIMYVCIYIIYVITNSNCFYLDLFINQVPYCNQFKPQ